MGKLIVIEGVCDGVGKTTQTKELIKNLINDGKEVITHHFPTYGSIGASLVETYLNGDLGSREEVGVYPVSCFFAMDRYYVYKTKLEKVLNDDKIVVLDRYISSNLIYQSSLLKGKEKDDYLNYITDFEYNKLGLRKPDVVIFLNLGKEYATKLRKKRVDNEGIVNDINERDDFFLNTVYDNSLEIAKKYNYKVVECEKNGELRSISDISLEIYKIVSSLF